MPRNVVAALCVAACTIAGAGCTSLPALRERPAEPAPTGEAIQMVQVSSLLEALASVVHGSPAQQAEVMAAARHDFEQARHGPAALRYGLLLAAPIHPLRNPVEAQQLLRESLSRPELLSAMERALAQVELERVTAELRLNDENQRLVTESQEARDRQRNEPSTAALARQLQAAQEQNARLRTQLDDARSKLDAIIDFERRQADRPPTSEGRNP